MQNEIREECDVLTKKGNVAVKGYSKHLVFRYNRRNIKRKLRIKEWDFYQILNDEYCLQMNIGHLSYVGSVSTTLINLKTGKKYSIGVLKPLVFNSFRMEANGEKNNCLVFQSKNFRMVFDVNGPKRVLTLEASNKDYQVFRINMELTGFPNGEAMGIVTPFAKPNQFFLNYKMNCFRGAGTVVVNDEKFTFGEGSYGLMDWGRGVWPSHVEWYWSNGSTKLPDGRLFGFNIGFGFGDLAKATENMLFVDGKAHKLESITVKNKEPDTMSDWVFSSSDGRYELTMTPVYDNASKTSIGPIFMECHQVFGRFNGKVVLDNGETIVIKDMLAFCEHSHNCW